MSEFAQHTYPILQKNKHIKKVLDVACGNGLGVSLPMLRKGLRVYAFDHTKAAINANKNNAIKEGYRINLKKASMYKTFPYKNNFFDSTFCFQAIFHGRLENIMFALSEIKRVTKNGGYFFGTFLNHDDLKNENNRYYIDVIMPSGKHIKSYLMQDSHEPHLFYHLSRNFEYMQPHYYFEKEELNAILKQFFTKLRIKKIKRKNNLSTFWFICGKV